MSLNVFLGLFLTLILFSKVIITQILTETVMKYHVSVDCHESETFSQNIVPMENTECLTKKVDAFE